MSYELAPGDGVLIRSNGYNGTILDASQATTLDHYLECMNVVLLDEKLR